jgi:hypothetical protein
MKITYTADDGTTWDTEDDCRGWEKFQAALAKEREWKPPYEDPDEPSDFDSFIELLLEGSLAERDLWRQRKLVYRLADLLGKATQQ